MSPVFLHQSVELIPTHFAAVLIELATPDHGTFRDSQLAKFLVVPVHQKDDIAGSDSPCYKLVLNHKRRAGDPEAEPLELAPLFVYVDKQSFLPAKFETTLISEAGEIPLELFPSEYREVDGVVIPFQMQTTVLGQKRVMTLESVKHNVDFAADHFAPPPVIKQLLNKDPADR